MSQRREARTTTSPSQLQEFATNSDELVRFHVARSRHTAANTLNLLAVDTKDWVAETAVGNENFTWSLELPVRIWLRHRARDLAALCDETSLALAENWCGSVETLLEASRLVEHKA